MSDAAAGERAAIRHTMLPNGETRLDLDVNGASVSGLYVIPLTITIGIARVRVDGIGGLETEEEHRGRGYARHVMEAAMARMLAADSSISPDPTALTILFGIANFYEKYGYTPAGPWYELHLTELAGGSTLPTDWTVRRCTPADLPAVHVLYERAVAQSIGAVIRHPAGRVWSALASAVADPARDECRVVTDFNGALVAYAWRGSDFWPVDDEEEAPDALVIGEAIAVGPVSADALLTACRAWAVEESACRPAVTKVQISLSPDCPIYAAATRQEAKLETSWTRSGGFMARTLHAGRLLAALVPELTRRLRASGNTNFAMLHVVTDAGQAALEISPDSVAARDSNEAPILEPTSVVHLRQQDLTRLAFGAFPTSDLLDRLDTSVDADARQWLELLFPQRHPYTYLPDWV